MMDHTMPRAISGKPPRRNARRLGGLLVSMLALAASTGQAEAQRDPSRTGSVGPAPLLNVGPGDQAISRRIDLSIGKSLIVDLPRDAKEIFVANPKVANAVVRSAQKLFIIGMADGATSIFALDAAGRQIAALEITVGRDLNVLRQTLRSALPSADVEIKPAGDSILLTGSVASPQEAQQAVDIANAFVGVQGGLLGSTKGGVINGLAIRGKDQVMIKVTVAEVSRTAIKQLGINLSSQWAGLGGAGIQSVTQNPFTIATQTLSGTQINLDKEGSRLGGTLRALERSGVSRVLAEPTLTAISGESAKFTAGGEIPIPKSETCTTGSTTLGGLAGARECTLSVEYKPFGVNLNFTPIVMSENRISVRIATEVSEIDASNQIRFTTTNAVAFRVRKSETTVELPSGGSIATAGLIQQGSRQAINGIPGLMNLPVLGALFRSRDYIREETELVIIATPFIVKPVAVSQLAKPDDGYVDASDPQTLLLGRLNRLYGVAGAPVKEHGYRGSYGFIND